MKEFSVIFTMLIFSSCATVFNSSLSKTTVYTTQASKIIFGDDTIPTILNSADLFLRRKKEAVVFYAVTDSLVKRVTINYRNSAAWYWNIYFNYGIGMLVERKNPKRFGYPRRVYLDSSDSTRRFYKYQQGDKKGKFLLHISLPHINSFQLEPRNEGTKLNTGFWGLSIGADYYYSTRQFLNVSLSGVSDFFVPVPAAVDISGEYELMSARYLSISNNHKIKRISVGYGLVYSRNTWDFRYYERFNPPPPTRPPVKKSHNALGLILSSYFQTGRIFNIGVLYRPTLFVTREQVFKYEHVISFDLAWKIPL